jgi:type I restriction enzyme S subunit
MTNESKIPSDWEIFKLSELANVQMGQSPDGETYNTDGNGVPFVQGNADLGEINPIVRIYTTNPKKFSDPDDILLTVRAPVGAMNINDKRIAIGRGIAAISEFDKTHYLYHYLKHNQWLMQRLEQGTTFTEINQREIKRLHIVAPNSPEERKEISNTISKVDEAIAATKNSIAKAERLKKALMQNLLTGKLKPDGTWRKNDEFYKDEKFGKLPKSWQLKRLGDCFDFFPTSSYSRATLLEQGDCKYIHYGDIHTKYQGFLDIEKAELPFITNEMEKKYTKVIDGDLILADVSEDYDGVGKAIEIINTGENKVIAGLHTLHLRGKNNYFVSGYKGYLLNHWKVRNSILRISAGIKVYSISKGTLSKILLPIPSPEEQKLIAEKLSAVDLQIENKQYKIKKLEHLKKALMQNLLTGKVRLPAEVIAKAGVKVPKEQLKTETR